MDYVCFEHWTLTLSRDTVSLYKIQFHDYIIVIIYVLCITCFNVITITFLIFLTLHVLRNQIEKLLYNMQFILYLYHDQLRITTYLEICLNEFLKLTLNQQYHYLVQIGLSSCHRSYLFIGYVVYRYTIIILYKICRSYDCNTCLLYHLMITPILCLYIMIIYRHFHIFIKYNVCPKCSNGIASFIQHCTINNIIIIFYYDNITTNIPMTFTLYYDECQTLSKYVSYTGIKFSGYLHCTYIHALLLCVDLGRSTMCMLSDSSLHTCIMDYMHCTYLGHVVLFVGLRHLIMCVSSLRKGMIDYMHCSYLGHDVMYYLYIEVECLSMNLLLSRRCSILKNKITSIHHG